MIKKSIVTIFIAIAIGIALWYGYQFQFSKKDQSSYKVYLVNPGGTAYQSYFDSVESQLKKIHPRKENPIQFIVKNAEGNPETLKTMISETVNANPDILVTVSSQPTQQAIKESNGKFPILSTLGDPVEHGYVESLKGSGTNLGGVAQQNISLTPKRIELLKELSPAIKKVAILYDTTCGPTKKARPIANDLAKKIDLELIEIALTNPSRQDVEKALAQIKKQDYDALMFYPHGSLFSKSDLFLKRATEEGLAIIMPNEEALAQGALAVYGPSYTEMGKLIARVAEKILTDKLNVKDLPWEQPSTINYLISVSNAEKLGITINTETANKAKLIK